MNMQEIIEDQVARGQVWFNDGDASEGYQRRYDDYRTVFGQHTNSFNEDRSSFRLSFEVRLHIKRNHELLEVMRVDYRSNMETDTAEISFSFKAGTELDRDFILRDLDQPDVKNYQADKRAIDGYLEQLQPSMVESFEHMMCVYMLRLDVADERTSWSNGKNVFGILCS